MNAFWVTMGCGIVGFLIGGLIGVSFFSGFFPIAWVGCAISLGLALFLHIWIHLDV